MRSIRSAEGARRRKDRKMAGGRERRAQGGSLKKSRRGECKENIRKINNESARSARWAPIAKSGRDAENDRASNNNSEAAACSSVIKRASGQSIASNARLRNAQQIRPFEPNSSNTELPRIAQNNNSDEQQKMSAGASDSNAQHEANKLAQLSPSREKSAAQRKRSLNQKITRELKGLGPRAEPGERRQEDPIQLCAPRIDARNACPAQPESKSGSRAPIPPSSMKQSNSRGALHPIAREPKPAGRRQSWRLPELPAGRATYRSREEPFCANANDEHANREQKFDSLASSGYRRIEAQSYPELAASDRIANQMMELWGKGKLAGKGLPARFSDLARKELMLESINCGSIAKIPAEQANRKFI